MPAMNAQPCKTASGRAAFTLVELLVVIGLMAMLGTISVSGYFAAQRGMTDRGAKQDAMSIIRLAMQTCLIDQTPTAVLFYNRRTEGTSGTSSSGEMIATGDEKGAVAGVAIAIKMAGRISYIDRGKNLLVDEFADWNQSYPPKSGSGGSSGSSGNSGGIRFYRMADIDKVEQGIDRCSSTMNSYVESVELEDEFMISAGRKVSTWRNEYKKTASDNREFSGVSYDNANSVRWGLGFNSRNSGVTASEWRIGDAYGVEISSLQLPKGYIFGSSEPNSMKIKALPSLAFKPDTLSGSDYTFNLNQTPTISAFRPEGKFVQVAKITREDLRDDED